jgi:hypothetical protein
MCFFDKKLLQRYSSLKKHLIKSFKYQRKRLQLMWANIEEVSIYKFYICNNQLNRMLI